MSESVIQEHQAMEFAKCATSVRYFMENYVYFYVPGEGPVRIKHLSHQRDLLVIIDQFDRVIILKARQIGVTWTSSGLMIHDTIFVPGANDLIFSRGEKEAAKTLRERCRFIWSNLPPFLQLPMGTDNNETLQFIIDERTDEYSYIRSFASTPGSGVGETATRVIMDEWGKIKPDSYAEQIYIDIEPVVEHGKLVIMSTAEGRGNFFARTYYAAKNGENEFQPVFIPYNVMPGRDAAWEAKTRRRYPGYMFNQNYPLHESDAFLIAGTCMFDVPTLKRFRPPQPLRELASAQIYEEPCDHQFFAGIDTALGIAGRDYLVCQIVCGECKQQAARLHLRIPLEQFAEKALELLEYYNCPNAIIEEQPQGRLVHKVFVDSGYPLHRLYHRSKNVPCWHTTAANRAIILGELEQGLRVGGLKLNHLETIEEFLGFGYNQEADKFEALSGHDDEVMAMALAYHQVFNALVPWNDFQAKSYVNPPPSDFEHILETNWKKKDPFNGRMPVPCPTCLGTRMVPNPHSLMSDVCTTCHGVGKMLRRLADANR